MQIEGAFFEPSDYEIIKEKEINNGPFSKVFLVQNRKNKKVYAAKILNSREGFEGRQQMLLLREGLLLHNFKYPSILSFIGVGFLSLSNPSIFEPTIITEYMENGSLGNILKKKTIDTILNCTKKYILLLGISDAMRFLHENSIIHRDLKPDNILIDENYYPKICDFGLARLIPEKMESIKMTEGIGTPMYMAPEMLTDDNDENFSYDQSIDVYAFGIIAYEIVTGNQPFSELGKITPIKLSLRIISGYRPQLNDNVTEKMKTLIRRCWNKNTKERPSFKEIYETLSTDFSYFKEKIDQKKVKDFIDYLEKEKNKTKSKIFKISKRKNDDDKDFDIKEDNLDEEDDDDEKNDDDEENEKIALFQDKKKLISYKLYEKTRTAEIIDSPNVIANVTIPKNVIFGLNKYKVIKICDKAFSGSSIEKLSFSPNSEIEEIGDSSFEGSELKSISIPKRLKILGKFWSKGALKLENIEIDPKNHHFSKNDDFMINKKTSEVLFVSRNFQGDLIIPKKTTSIGDYSFTEHRGILSFISSAPLLNRIGSYSFSKCSNLKNIKISQEGPKLTLEKFCFSDATNLSSFEISCNKLEIQNDCFNNCNLLTSFKVIKSNEIEIHSQSFSGCNALQNISFGDSSDIIIGQESFKCKDQLKTVSFGKVSKVNIFQKAFYNCRNLESISIKNSSEINIKEECFRGSNRLKSIELIADSVKFDKSFVKDCISLSNVNIQSKENISINSDTFLSCQLNKVIFHSPNLKFYPLCFNGQKNLESIEIESQNLELNKCFNNCNSLKSLSLKNENGLAVTNDLLNGCTSIVSLTIDVQSRLTIPNDFMNGSKNLVDVVMKGNEVVVGNSCFAKCTELKKFTILDSGSINIGNNLFDNCKKLEKITIGHNPKSASRIEINNTCFNKAENLKEFIIIGGNVKLINTDSKFCSSLTNLSINDANRVEINDKQFQSLKSLQHVVIKSKSDVKLGSECFYDSNGLETVTIVGSNISISNRCFVNCNSLSKLDILNGTNLTLGSYVFSNCSKLEDLKLNIKQVRLEEKCFNGSSIITVEINGENVIINNECFKNLSSLKSIKIISKNIQLERNSFEGCKNLNSISFISEMRLIIGDNCFYNNTRIVHIELEGNIIEIGGHCFNNCTSIRALNLTCNDRITLGNNAFECCTNINNILVLAENKFTAGDHCFLNANNIINVQITSKEVLLNDFCFSKCSRLKTFSILNGENVSFKNKIFDSCELLTTVKVAANANFNANNYCFQKLSNLRNVIINSSHIVFLSYCFVKCNSLRQIDCGLANSIEYCNSSLNERGLEFIRTEGSATLSRREENIDPECTIQ